MQCRCGGKADWGSAQEHRRETEHWSTGEQEVDWLNDFISSLWITTCTSTFLFLQLAFYLFSPQQKKHRRSNNQCPPKLLLWENIVEEGRKWCSTLKWNGSNKQTTHSQSIKYHWPIRFCAQTAGIKADIACNIPDCDCFSLFVFSLLSASDWFSLRWFQLSRMKSNFFQPK